MQIICIKKVVHGIKPVLWESREKKLRFLLFRRHTHSLCVCVCVCCECLKVNNIDINQSKKKKKFIWI